MNLKFPQTGLLKKLAFGGLLAAGVATMSVPAGALVPTGYGFDGNAHIIVGGGSDTTYRAMVGLTDLYNGSPGCPSTTAVGSTLNTCAADPANGTNTQGNFQHDTVAQANPVGSGAGIASLNGFGGAVYNGTVNNGVNVDFARSSRGPARTGGKISGGDELSGDTFWGYSQDGVEVMSFESRGAQIQGAGGSALTPAELYHIWNCDYTTWSQVPSLGIAPGSATDGPIVPWGLNSSSGTFGTFNSYLISQGGAPANWTVDGQACDRKLTATNNYAFENDIKPLFNDAGAAITDTDYSSVNNPNNWIWFGSYGVLNAFSYTSNYTYPLVTGNLWNAIPLPINGILPSSSKILANTYPIGRTLYHVTKNTDADCPQAGGVTGSAGTPGAACDFTNNPGPTLPSGTGTDLNVTGGTSGISGAVREFTRWLCRSGSAAQAIDPYTGKNYSPEITTALNNSGFTVVPVALRTSGSACQVLT